MAFRGAAPRNMKNRDHFSDYGEGMRIKNERLHESIRRTGWQATKSR
jgi:hypothetical protein